MSKETLAWLNNNVLVGMTDKRGHAWHYKASEQGAESNHYAGFVPVADVKRRLFHWTADARPIGVSIPTITPSGVSEEWTTIDGRKAIVRSDTGAVLGIFGEGYQPHQYAEWLLGTVGTILSGEINITSAGLLKGGAVGWVECSVPDNVHTPEGVTFRPNILAGTSLDGSVATFFKRTITETVCDNTLSIARAESSTTYRVKHTRHSGFKLADAREALDIIWQSADDFADAVAQLCATDVTDRQWSAFLDGFAPVKDARGIALEGRSLTMAENKRETMGKLWNHDERVSPWRGTAFGVIQAANTYQHHEAIVRGTSRVERNLLNAIDGTTEKNDAETIAILDRVLTTV
jgi:phage/plasmid-like protein (TIGR03299 family)